MRQSNGIRPRCKSVVPTSAKRRRRLLFEGLEPRRMLALLVVSTAADEDDGDHSPGHLSLREALALAAAMPGRDVIEFDDSLAHRPIWLAHGQLEIDSNVEIRGLGAEQLTVDGLRSRRAFYVPEGVDATISGLRITRGSVDYRDFGGGICNSGSLRVTDAVIVDSNGGWGGGFCNYGGTATLTNVIIARTQRASAGGGFCNYRGTATLTNVIISGNYASTGAGFYNLDGMATLTDVTISDNRALSWGGGFRNSNGTVTLIDVTISGNSAEDGGGLLSARGTVTLTNATISDNSVQWDAVGHREEGGGIMLWGATATLTNVTISGNSAEDYGGGFYSFNGTSTLTNVTISGNSAGDRGGGFYIYGGRSTLTNVTISGNSDGRDHGGVNYSRYTKPLMHNTIVADGFGGSLEPGSSHNLIGGPIMLGPLADNGGPTLTHALLPGSPAIDAGSNERAAEAGLTTDQRGYDRFLDGNGDGRATVDIGAVEAPEEPITPSPNTPGLYDPYAGAFHLRNSNTRGEADFVFKYGPARHRGWIPLVGDWDGDGTDTVGLYDPLHGWFHLKNTNSNPPGGADVLVRFGPALPRWQPIVGDWDGDGFDTVGLYDPLHGGFHLKNSHVSGGGADVVFRYGPANPGTWKPLVGDWDGDGVDTVGLYDSLHAGFHLKNVNSNPPHGADVVFRFGPVNLFWKPLAGDFDGDGLDSVGMYDPAGGGFHLKNVNANPPGGADLAFRYGPAINFGWTPLIGDWDGPEQIEPAGFQAASRKAADMRSVAEAFSAWADSDDPHDDSQPDGQLGPAEIDAYFAGA